MASYVDAHCHLGQYDDPIAALDAAVAAGVVTVAVTETPDEFRRLRTRFGDRAGLRLALGAHPLKASLVQRELVRFQRLLLETSWIGEIGLDYSRHAGDTAAAQRLVFEAVLAMPHVRHKVVTVHSRGAEKDTITMLRAAGVTAILHWWTGPISLVTPALDNGLWFSVNAAMCQTKKGQAVIERLPRDRVLTETDGPYTGPRNRPTRPEEIPAVVTMLASMWRVDAVEVRDQVWKNMADLYRSTVGSADS